MDGGSLNAAGARVHVADEDLLKQNDNREASILERSRQCFRELLQAERGRLGAATKDTSVELASSLISMYVHVHAHVHLHIHIHMYICTYVHIDV